MKTIILLAGFRDGSSIRRVPGIREVPSFQSLEQQINEFFGLSQKLTSDRRLDTRQAKSEVQSLQFKWNAFTRLVEDYRRLIGIAVQYFTVLDEV